MNIFINGRTLSIYYHDACADNLPDGGIENVDELHDFLNAYDGCAFE